MNELEDMRILVEILDRRSFSAASKRLGISKQLVSRRVIALEERLGVQLLTRTTRQLSPTDPGRDYADRARRILTEVEEAALAVSTHRVRPRGILRVSAPLTFGVSYLSPLIARFMVETPEVEIELDLNDRLVDLIGEGFDMAIRIGTLPDSTLIARKLMDAGLAVVGSPDYLSRRGIPITAKDLKLHDCLQFRHGRGTSWLLREAGREITVPVSGPMRTNNGEALRDAALAGLGLAQLPFFLTEDALAEGRLTSVMDDLRPINGAVYAIHPSHRQRSLPVRAFSDYLAQALR